MLKGIFLIALLHLNELSVLCQVLKCSMGTKLGDTLILLYVCQGNMILCLTVRLTTPPLCREYYDPHIELWVIYITMVTIGAPGKSHCFHSNTLKLNIFVQNCRKAMVP